MKGKTGKPAMRGGGLARKGTGMALKGGGMARKGTGSNATPGGKVKKMAVGGFTGGEGGRRGEGGGRRGDVRRPGIFPGKPNMGGTPKPGMSGGKGGPGAGMTVQQNPGAVMQTLGTTRPGPQTMATPAHGGKPSPAMIEQYRQNLQSTAKPAKKDGGKVSKYAKGGAVKMTAGAGSGSGRLEKVAAHKGAKRVPAANLKSGGKVKGK